MAANFGRYAGDHRRGSGKVLTDTPTYSGSLEILVQPSSAESEVIANIPETLANGQLVPAPRLMQICENID